MGLKVWGIWRIKAFFLLKVVCHTFVESHFFEVQYNSSRFTPPLWVPSASMADGIHRVPCVFLKTKTECFSHTHAFNTFWPHIHFHNKYVVSLLIFVRI